MLLRTIFATLVLMALTIGLIYWGVSPQSDEAAQVEPVDNTALVEGQEIGEAASGTLNPDAVTPKVDQTAKKKAEAAKKKAKAAKEAAKKKAKKAKQKAQERREKMEAAKRAAKAKGDKAVAEIEHTQDQVENITLDQTADAVPINIEPEPVANEGVLKLFRQGVEEAQQIDDPNVRDQSYMRLVSYATSNGIFDSATSLIPQLSTAKMRDQARSLTAGALAGAGKSEQALELLDQLENQDEVEELKTDVETIGIDPEVQRLPRK